MEEKEYLKIETSSDTNSCEIMKHSVLFSALFSLSVDLSRHGLQAPQSGQLLFSHVATTHAVG